MKEFDISTRPLEFGWAERLTLKQRCLFAGLIWLIYFATSLVWGEISFEGILLCCIYSLLLIKTNTTKSKANNYFEQKLVFGSDNLVLESSDTIHWHIPFHRLDRIEQVKNPNSMTLVYTNDNDSYLIYGKLSTETIDEIQQEIEQIKASTQGRTNA